MKKALLVNPWIYDFAAFDFWAKPLGLLYLGSILRHNGFEVEMVDCMDRNDPDLCKISPPKKDTFGTGHFHFEEIEKPEILKGVKRRYKRYGLPKDLFLQRLERFKEFDYIFFTSIMTFWYLGLFDAIKIVRSLFKNTPIVLGGIYPTLCFEHAKEKSSADYVIDGFAEEKLGFLGIPRYESLDSLPYPAYDLYKHLDYACVLTSRGCPFRCTYCASPRLFNGLYQRYYLKVVEEIEHYYWKLKVKDIVFYDDALFYSAENHIKKILDEIIRRKLKCRFHTPNGLHPKFITERLAHMLRRAHFKSIYLSLETSYAKRQKNTGGKVTNKELIDAIDNLEKAGYRRKDIVVYLMVGMPDQEVEEVIQSIVFVSNLGAKVHLAEYSPIPSTVDWKYAEKILPSNDPLFHNNSIFPLYRDKSDEFQKVKDLAKVANFATRFDLGKFITSNGANPQKIEKYLL